MLATDLRSAEKASLVQRNRSSSKVMLTEDLSQVFLDLVVVCCGQLWNTCRYLVLHFYGFLFVLRHVHLCSAKKS